MEKRMANSLEHVSDCLTLWHVMPLGLNRVTWIGDIAARDKAYDLIRHRVLGRQSKAVHRAYAKRTLVKIPSLEGYEKRNEPHTEVQA